MLLVYYLTVAALAGVATLAWLFVEQRVTVTSFVAWVCWTILAVYGGGVEKLLDDGTRAEAAVPTEVRFVLFGLALFSFLALALYQLGVYPPDTSEPYHEAETNAQR